MMEINETNSNKFVQLLHLLENQKQYVLVIIYGDITTIIVLNNSL